MSTRRGNEPAGALVLGDDYKALGVVRSLGRRGIPVWVQGDGHLLAGRSRYCARRLPSCDGDEAGQVANLLDIARAHRLQGWVLFPGGEETAALLSRNRAALSERYRVAVPPWNVLRWAYDKRLTYRLAADLGIDHPNTFYPRGADDVARFAGPFPAILKPAMRPELNRFTMSKAWRVEDAADLAARYDEARDLIDPSLIMVQELIPGGGDGQFSYAALCRAGRPLVSLTARRTRQWPMDFGRASTYVETVREADVEANGRRVLEALAFDGIVEVEFKRDARDGRLKLLDINPRVWGWHTLGARAGIDFSYLLWRFMSDEPIPTQGARIGVRWVRALTDVPMAIGEIRAGRLSVSAYLASLRGPIEFAVLAGDDPLPALLEAPASAYLAWKRRTTQGRTSPAPRVAEPIVSGLPAGERR